jgi:DNA-binding HxlR family transcriptional regulator
MKGCAFEQIVDVVGDRWSLLLINALLSGPRRTTELATLLNPISTRTLAERLKRLEAAGVLTRRAFAEAPPRVEYTLTDRGAQLRHVLAALRSAATAWELHDCGDAECSLCTAECAPAEAPQNGRARARAVDITLL